MKKILFVVVLQLCGLLTILAPGIPAAQAQIALLNSQYTQCSFVNKVCVNPIDSNIWAAYKDNSTPKISYLGNYARDGHRLALFQIPANRQLLTITFEPGDIRLYYEEYHPDAPAVFSAFGYVDLQTGETHKVLDIATIPDGCDLQYDQNWYYNSARKQFYLTCTSYNGPRYGVTNPSRTAIIDTTTNKLVKLVDFIVLGAHNDGDKLYAYRQYREKVDDGYRPEKDFFDLYLVNDQTFEPTADQPLIKHQWDFDALSSFKVNYKTGLVYMTTQFVDSKGAIPQSAVVDWKGNIVAPFTDSKVTGFTAINEANNQVYGNDLYANTFGRTERDILDGANVGGDRLAMIYWEPGAFDAANNLIYATFYSEEGGSTLLVINGKTNSVQGFIQLNAPPASFTDNAKPVPAPPSGIRGLYFKDTGHTLTGKFFDYWQKNGGLAGFGLPITEPFQEPNNEAGHVITVQYFERARLELHPENAGTPYEVELGLLGHQFTALTGPRVNGQFISGETSPVSGGILFKETGHTVTGKFLEYWQQNGGLARHGLPLTEPTEEKNPIDGKTYLVQYFERSRLELHPEFAGTPYEVLMGLLGTQSLRAQGWPV